MFGGGKAQLTQREVEDPPNRYCKSGHIPPLMHQRDPPHPPERTRFYQVTSDVDPSVNGVYCEPCLVVAHWQAAQQQKTNNGHGL